MERSVKKFIGDCEYEITKPLADEGLVISLAVGKVVVPFLADFFASGGNMALSAEAVGKLVMNLTPEQIRIFNTSFGKLTSVTLPDTDTNGNPLVLRLDAKNFNNHFCDRYDEWLTWLRFAIEVVCGSFLRGRMGLGALLKKKPSATEDPKKPDLSSQSLSPVERTG